MAEQHALTFTGFVVSLATTAAVHFGDLADPATGARQTNLVAAGQMIDILAMLQEKTKGNLTPEETRLVDDLLYELRLRYVEAGKPESPIVTP
jgi:hypothetical protein